MSGCLSQVGFPISLQLWRSDHRVPRPKKYITTRPQTRSGTKIRLLLWIPVLVSSQLLSLGKVTLHSHTSIWEWKCVLPLCGDESSLLSFYYIIIHYSHFQCQEKIRALGISQPRGENAATMCNLLTKLVLRNSSHDCLGWGR